MTPPTPGQTYTSATNPDIAFYIEETHTSDDDGFYLVETCHPSAIGDMSAMGHEFTCDEWAAMVAEHGLTPSAC